MRLSRIVCPCQTCTFVAVLHFMNLACVGNMWRSNADSWVSVHVCSTWRFRCPAKHKRKESSNGSNCNRKTRMEKNEKRMEKKRERKSWCWWNNSTCFFSLVRRFNENLSSLRLCEENTFQEEKNLRSKPQQAVCISFEMAYSLRKCQPLDLNLPPAPALRCANFVALIPTHRPATFMTNTNSCWNYSGKDIQKTNITSWSTKSWTAIMLLGGWQHANKCSHHYQYAPIYYGKQLQFLQFRCVLYQGGTS